MVFVSGEKNEPTIRISAGYYAEKLIREKRYDEVFSENLPVKDENGKYVSYKQLKNKHITVRMDYKIFQFLYESGDLEYVLKKYIPNADIELVVGIGKVDDAHKIDAFIECDKMLRERGNVLYFLEQFDSLIHYEMIDVLHKEDVFAEWVNTINSATYNGQPLSPMEKYIYAYMLVKDRIGKENDTGDRGLHGLSREVISVLNSDYCVCVGFASLLMELCSRIGIPCVRKAVRVNECHEINAVLINDEKYKITNALFYSDPTYDRKDNGNTMLSVLLPSLSCVYDSYTDVENDSCYERDQKEADLFESKDELLQAQENAAKVPAISIANAIVAVLGSQGKTDINKELATTGKAVMANLNVYKNTWVGQLISNSLQKK